MYWSKSNLQIQTLLVNEIGLDEFKIDKTAVDEIAVDELKPSQSFRYISGMRNQAVEHNVAPFLVDNCVKNIAECQLNQSH